MTDQATQEFEAIKSVHDALAPLEHEGRARVLTYIASLLGIDAKAVGAGNGEGVANDADEAEADMATKEAPIFSEFAELYAAADPKTNSAKALVVGYWLQVCHQSEHFTAAAANKELSHLGEKLANITSAIDDLKRQRPPLALQLKKSGSSQQARKSYKVTRAGVKRVEEMIGG